MNRIEIINSFFITNELVAFSFNENDMIIALNHEYLNDSSKYTVIFDELNIIKCKLKEMNIEYTLSKNGEIIL